MPSPRASPTTRPWARCSASSPTRRTPSGCAPPTPEWLRTTYPNDGQNREERKAYWFAMAHPQRGELMGEIGLVGISWPNRRAGLSILVLPASRRAGIGREAIEVLVGWAQGELGLHRIELHTLSETLRRRDSPRRPALCTRAFSEATASNEAGSSTTSSTPGSRHDRWTDRALLRPGVIFDIRAETGIQDFE
jgi:GNAT superfamily N-acetyltransferase